jgi:hypothetical protein
LNIQNLGVGEAARRIGLNHPGEIGDAVEQHLRLLPGIAAERAVGK